MVSRRTRKVLRPILFRRVRWQPFPGQLEFIPDSLIPFIQVFTLCGDAIALAPHLPLDYPGIVEILRQQLPTFVVLHTFILGKYMYGGLWTELVDALSAAPMITTLDFLSRWEMRKTTLPPYLLDDNFVSPPFRTINYPFPTCVTGIRNYASLSRRTRIVLETEGANLRRLTSACHTTLEHLTIPGELFILAIDVALDWSHLRELVLQEADFPSLRAFSVWYVIPTEDDLYSEDSLLESIPRKFPLLENLVVNRLWHHTSLALKDRWDPAPRFRRLLSRLRHLKHLSLNVDHPERFRRRPFYRLDDPELEAHVEHLAALVIEIVSLCPTLQRVSMYRELGDNVAVYWQHWEVIRSDDGSVTLQPF
ncbi:hypothetical protein MIND_00668700 [Mycena indigotica]|uniref:Uncharacterized protein n=1 Tax=Mycena indigotica TaxID=2126181 RepID=A0A8H6SK13_9AGAR|nr:uncharacterized protein MIND_00668700 [Mycena indigotica]KAF7301048.1 hypothetical protein MIND_00668700 [Mycena indigotica]